MTRSCCVLALLALVLLPGCPSPTRREGDAGPETDAFSGVDGGADVDAFADMDAAMDDAAMDDAGSPGTDAFVGADATWGACTYAGAMGVCESTSLCPAGSMSMPGLCPGPADIQCCLPIADSGMPGSITPAQILARLGACTRIGGDYAYDSGGTPVVPICQTDNVVWWQADMDIDCDGGLGAVCMSDPYYMASTSAVDSSGNALDASTLPFIVIPLPSTRWRFASSGIALGQVALVLYNGRMAWCIFGDEGPSSGIGEASFAMAELLGVPSSPISGGVDSGVTYLVFTGATARVTHNESHAEAVAIGDPLLHAFVGL